jgi:predicted dithiol-disulfide oxidoreductase (DUF899 family)
MGRTFRWAFSHGGDFNVSLTEGQQREGGFGYNYRRAGRPVGGSPVLKAVARFEASCETDAPTSARDPPGMSAFVLEGGIVHHTYSTHARGLDGIWGLYPWLDLAPKGLAETDAL